MYYLGRMLPLLLLLVGMAVVTSPAHAATAPWESAYSAPSFGSGAGGGAGPIRQVYCDLVGLMQGSFGGLLLSAAALMAIAGAMMGDFSGGKAAIMVGVCSFTIAAGISLYFGDLGCGLDGGNGNAPVLRTLDADTGDDTGLF